ncbi:MAG TPA: sulfatase-like hydrolase/transferase [Blastocatellia bacterium]|nr:sulfatase-like hydrolase/transferase [Blastocatellia bacterium]
MQYNAHHRADQSSLMRRKNLAYSALLALVLNVTLISGLCLAQYIRKPNVVILHADDLGYGDVGAYGNKIVPTPHIDRLACEGVRFTNGYVTASICKKTCAKLIISPPRIQRLSRG